MKWMAVLCAVLVPMGTFALSRSIGRDIEFPKNYDPKKAEAIRKVIQNERFKFVGGIVSYWPPDWSTRLSFDGDVTSFNGFVAELRKIDGIGLRFIRFQGRNDESRRDSAWQLNFSHARTNELTLYLNLNSTSIDFAKVTLPEEQTKP
jgi:hypothetical protein